MAQNGGRKIHCPRRSCEVGGKVSHNVILYRYILHLSLYRCTDIYTHVKVAAYNYMYTLVVRTLAHQKKRLLSPSRFASAHNTTAKVRERLRNSRYYWQRTASAAFTTSERCAELSARGRTDYVDFFFLLLFLICILAKGMILYKYMYNSLEAI